MGPTEYKVAARVFARNGGLPSVRCMVDVRCCIKFILRPKHARRNFLSNQTNQPNLTKRCAMLAAVETASRRLRRWPAASLDCRSARRTLRMQAGAKKRLSTEQRNSRKSIGVYPTKTPWLKKPHTSTGLKLGGAGEWLLEKHGTSRRRSWRKLHIGIDAASGEIVAVEVTKKEIDDGAVVDALLDQIADPIASFTADGDYDQDRVYPAVTEHHPDAAVIVPSRAGAVLTASAETAPTQRDHHLRMTAERGRMAWQKASGFNLRAKVETSISRYKRVIGDALRSRTDPTEATEIAIAAAALNRTLAFGRTNYVRIA
jgi:Transposase DDE domain